MISYQESMDRLADVRIRYVGQHGKRRWNQLWERWERWCQRRRIRR